jgi:NAD(P)-dependent dehydrogenase (short-subunit alcohol dehydrogenase family)
MTLALVTGANRGIGLEVCRQLADRDVDVLLTAREEERARAAAQELWDEGLDTVHPRVLDVTSGADVQRLCERVEQEFGGLDVLVNNAGVGLDFRVPVLEADLDVVRETIEVNCLSALRVTIAFAPMLRGSPRARIVNVSSGMGGITEMGGGSPGYRISKAGLNAVTRMLATELHEDGVLVNAACPGLVRTDMGGPGARNSVEEGADTPVWLATLPDDGPTGGFFRDREPIPW